MTSISTMLEEQRANGSDIERIYELYSAPTPPPVLYIRRPDFVDVLLRTLFDTENAVVAEDVKKMIFVAAYASAVVDTRPILAYADISKAAAPSTFPTIDRKHLDSISQHVSAVRELCKRSYFGADLIAAVDHLRQHVDSPLASLGIILWIRTNLVEGNNFATAFNTKSFSSLFGLLREICHLHPFQRPKVFDVLTACFEVQTELDALVALSAKRVVVDHFAFLMEVGFVPPVLKYATTWARLHVDQSITRHFVTKVLDNSEPPYSPQFIEAMVSMLLPLTSEALKSSETAKVVNPFLLHCAYSGYALSRGTSKQLQALLSTSKKG